MPTPDETRALIERAIAAFNARSIAGVLECLSEDVAHDPNQAPRQIGRDAFERYLVHRFRCYREGLGDVEILVAGGGYRAAAEYTLRGEYVATDGELPEATGQHYSVPGGTFFDIDNGRISRWSGYYNLNDWKAQVGR